MSFSALVMQFDRFGNLHGKVFKCAEQVFKAIAALLGQVLRPMESEFAGLGTVWAVQQRALQLLRFPRLGGATSLVNVSSTIVCLPWIDLTRQAASPLSFRRLSG